MVGLPEWLKPMAATLTQDRFVAPGWVFERKLDGIRLLAFKRGAKVRLLSRNRLSQDQAYPGIAAAVAALPVEDAILDGEATGVWGERGEALYHVFDLPWLNGRDLVPLPLATRREFLEAVPLRSPRHWLKMKCEAIEDLVVGGFTEPRGSRVGLGALLVGHFEGDDFCFAGRVGTGFGRTLLVELRARLDALEVPQPPFTKGVALPRGAHWVRPEVVVQVAFIEWTQHGKLRHPRLLGVRTDEAAAGVATRPP